MSNYSRNLFSRLMLLHDGSVIGFAASSEENCANESVPRVAALVIEPCGSAFHALHRDGTVIRQVTACCTSSYFSFVEDALLFRNSVVRNPYVCRNVFHIERFDVEARARWPIVSNSEIREVAKNASSADVKNSMKFSCLRPNECNIDLALPYSSQICCYANGSVVIKGVYDNDPSIFSLSPTGHFIRVSFSVSVPPLDNIIEYHTNAASDPAHCRVAQLFSARNVPPCFEYPLTLAQKIQKHYRLRNNLGQSFSFSTIDDASNAIETEKDGDYIICPLPCLDKESESIHWAAFSGEHRRENSHLSLNATEILSSVSRNGVGNKVLSSHAIMVERTDEVTVRAFVAQPMVNVMVEAHLHVDDSCLILDGDFFHFYRVTSNKSTSVAPYFEFTENVFHHGAIEHIDIGSTCEACIQFRAQILKQLHHLDGCSTKCLGNQKNLNCIKEERQENESGAYTVFPDGSIHILFRDRTTVDFQMGDDVANIIFPDAVQRKVSFRNPQKDIYIYIRLALEFVNWVRLSPRARKERHGELEAQQRKIKSESGKIDRLLVLMNRAPIPMSTHRDEIPIVNKNGSENIAMDTMAEIEKMRQSIHGCLHISTVEVSKCNGT